MIIFDASVATVPIEIISSYSSTFDKSMFVLSGCGIDVTIVIAAISATEFQESHMLFSFLMIGISSIMI